MGSQMVLTPWCGGLAGGGVSMARVVVVVVVAVAVAVAVVVAVAGGEESHSLPRAKRAG